MRPQCCAREWYIKEKDTETHPENCMVSEIKANLVKGIICYEKNS